MRPTRELRKFGFVMFVPLAGLGALFLWRERVAGPWVLGIAAAFALAAFVVPRALAPVERIWMRFAHVLGTVMTTVILTLTYFLVMTPMGVVMRLAGKDLLAMKFDPEAESYWIPVEEDGPASRPDKPY